MMYLLAAILLLSTISATTAQCPVGCRCWVPEARYFGPDLLSIACDNRQWTEVASGISADVTDLSLSGNKLSSLPKYNFIFPRLRILYLRANKFTKINDDTVKVLTSLSHLKGIDLSGNAWDCSCSPAMVALAKWLESLRGPNPSRKWMAIINAHNTQCTAPPNLLGKRFDEIKEGDIC